MSAVLAGGAVGVTGTRTVTRTVASVVPPSPFAVMWNSVEFEGDTVWVPFRLTGPMPSMVTEVAFWLRQLSTTDWPKSMARGSAVMVAVGAGAASAGAGPRVLGFTPLAFLWQPVTAASVTKVATKTRDLRSWTCTALIIYLLPSLVFQKINLVCEAILQGKASRHFQLQFGMSAPGPVKARLSVPSASMVMIFMWLALPSAVLA